MLLKSKELVTVPWTELWVASKKTSWPNRRKRSIQHFSIGKKKSTEDIMLQVVRQLYAFRLSSRFPKKMTESPVIWLFNQSCLMQSTYNLSWRNDCIHFSQNLRIAKITDKVFPLIKFTGASDGMIKVRTAYYFKNSPCFWILDRVNDFHFPSLWFWLLTTEAIPEPRS